MEFTKDERLNICWSMHEFIKKRFIEKQGHIEDLKTVRSILSYMGSDADLEGEDEYTVTIHALCLLLIEELENGFVDSIPPLTKLIARINENVFENEFTEQQETKQITESNKFCPKCKQSKPFSCFNKNKSAKDGLQAYCRECQKQSKQKMQLPKTTLEVPKWMDTEESLIFQNYVQYRKEIHHPLKPTGITYAIDRLKKFKDDGHNVVDVMRTTMANGWLGLFTPKEYPYLKNNNTEVK
jgi:hypothetical protein